MNIRLLVCTVCLLGGMSSYASASILPPPKTVLHQVYLSANQFDPTNPYQVGDDFAIYSTALLEKMQELFPSELPEAVYGNYSTLRNAGVGTQDLVIYSQASNGQSNPGTIDDPLNAATGGTSTFGGTWGDGVGQGGKGPGVTVADVLSFMPNGTTIPVFVFDHNQTGANPDLFSTGKVEIVRNGVVIKTWAFDSIRNSMYDETAFILSPATLTVDPDGPGVGEDEFTVNNNTGSGKSDFFGYAPTMDLSKFMATDQFRVTVNFAGLNNGGEELFISGTLGMNAVPEPSTIAIWSVIGIGGLFGANRYRRRQK